MTKLDTEEANMARMSLGDHLEELRRRIILGLIGPVAGGILLLFYGRQLVVFLAQPLLIALHDAGVDPKFHFMDPTSPFTIYLKVSLIGGLILGLPWLLWQIWKFVAAGLYAHERKFVRLLIPGSSVLTITGLVFMYYIMLPVVLAFFIGFALSYPPPDLQSEGFLDPLTGYYQAEPPPPPPLDAADIPPVQVPLLRQPPPDPEPGDLWFQWPEMALHVVVGEGRVLEFHSQSRDVAALDMRLDEYISFVLWLALAFAVAFQLPLIMLLVSGTGIVELDQMKAGRKYAFFGCFVVGALLGPADPFSMFFLAVPLYALWELGLVLVGIFVEPNRPEQT